MSNAQTARNKRRVFTQEERKKIYAKCDGHCAYCGVEIDIREMQVDHIVSIYSKENDILFNVNAMENLLPACKSCNHYKHSMSLDIFRKYINGIAERLRQNNVVFRIAERYGSVEVKNWDKCFYFEKINQGVRK